MGVWAYGLYLVHKIIPDFVLRATGADPTLLTAYDWGAFALSIAIVFAVAGLSWRYFEAPLIVWGHQRTSYRPAVAPAIA